jgi:hypothetical protein
MNFEKKSLPDFILADLYKDTLVVLDDIKASEKKNRLTVPSPTSTELISFLGENKKRIVILQKEYEAVHINEENYTFLSTILAACKLNVGDVAIVNTVKKTVNFSTLSSQLNPAIVLLFDLTTQDIELPFSIPNYQIQKFNECTFLTAVSLNKMLGNSQEAKVEKTKLWMSLKNIFGI